MVLEPALRMARLEPDDSRLMSVRLTEELSEDSVQPLVVNWRLLMVVLAVMLGWKETVAFVNIAASPLPGC